MKKILVIVVVCVGAAGLLEMLTVPAMAQKRSGKESVETMTVIAEAPGVDKDAEAAAVRLAEREAIEKTNGVFLQSATRTEGGQIVYDTVISDTSGYVRSRVLDVTRKNGTTKVRVEAQVSRTKFEEAWDVARKAHYPVVIVVCTAKDPQLASTTQGPFENSLNKAGIPLVSLDALSEKNKRDMELARAEGDSAKMAAIGAGFGSDVVVDVEVSVKYLGQINVGQAVLHQYDCSLTVRAAWRDSARLLMSNTYRKTVNECNRGAEGMAIVRFGDEVAPKVLKELLEAWDGVRIRIVDLTITGMTRDAWKKLEAEVKDIDGVVSVRLRELTGGVATIEVETQRRSKLTTDDLAGHLEELESISLEITEQSSNRLKCEVVKK